MPFATPWETAHGAETASAERFIPPMTLFSKCLVVLNGLGAIGSLVLLIPTWQSQGIIIRNARPANHSSNRRRIQPTCKKLT